MDGAGIFSRLKSYTLAVVKAKAHLQKLLKAIQTKGYSHSKSVCVPYCCGCFYLCLRTQSLLFFLNCHDWHVFFTARCLPQQFGAGMNMSLNVAFTIIQYAFAGCGCS